MISFRRWQARHLFGAWMAYWVALVAVLAARPLLELWRISRSPTGHGTINYSYSGDLLGLVLWIAGPPLVLFGVWAVTRPRASAPEGEAEREQEQERERERERERDRVG